ncbi:MAG: hypothetical protein KKE44_26335 [Proteobacteria bacterium]|nr:hypothetical protein [Bacteroidota bacterium]MBU1586250.1 hypothetical protein [Pseudomonadota bacterium]
MNSLRTIISETGSLKTIICGPPHSGKSVFVLNLLQHLPRQKAYCFRACPDGEGDWSGFSDQVLVEKIRQKGRFDEKFTKFALTSIRNTMKPIFFVDVGGRIDDKNQRIFSECNAFIIVSSELAETAKWREFGEKCGLVCLAELNSVLEGEDEIFDDSTIPLKARVTGLNRGAFPKSKAIACVAKILDNMTQELKDNSSAMIVMDELANNIGVEVKGTRGFNWQGKDLYPAVEAVSYLKTIEDTVTIDGGGAAFVYATLVHAVHPSTVEIRDPKVEKGYVKLPSLKMANGGSKHLNWKVEDRSDYTFMEFSIPDGVFDDTVLPEVIVPEVCHDKGVVVSGRGPIYLSVAIIMAYKNTAWVASFYPQNKEAIIVIRNSSDAPQLGEVIPEIYPLDDVESKQTPLISPEHRWNIVIPANAGAGVTHV